MEWIELILRSVRETMPTGTWACQPRSGAVPEHAMNARRPVGRATRPSVARMLIPALFALCFSIAAHAQTPRIDELKAQIAANPDSYELGAWQVELAEQLLATLSVDSADTSVLYGIPTNAQQARVTKTALEAVTLAQRSRPVLARGIDTIASLPEFADDRELQDLRSQLAVEYMMIRRPLAHARAIALIHATQQVEVTPNNKVQVFEQTRSIDPVSPMIQARIFNILAAHRIDGVPANELNQFAIDSVTSKIREQSEHVWRELILARSREMNSTDARRLLETELIEKGSASPLNEMAAREMLVWRQFGNPYAGPRSIAPILMSDASRANSALAELVIEKCRRTAYQNSDAVNLHPVDLIALGRNKIDAQEWDAAISALQDSWETLAESDHLFKRLCGWDLARALRERGSPQDIADAGAVLLELAQFPDEPNAEQALASSIQLLQWSDRALAQQGADRSNVGAALRQALRLGLAKWPKTESADEWRLALANVVSGAEQRDLLESITARSGAFPRARLALAWLTYASLSKAPSDAQREAEAFTMLQFADQARAAAEQSAGDEFASLGASIDQARAIALAELRRFEPAAEAAIAWDDAGGAGQPDAIDLVRRRAGEALRESLLIRDEERAAAIGALLDPLCIRLADRIKARKADRALIDAVAIDLNDAMVAKNQATELLAIAQDWSTSFGVTRGVGIALATGLRASGDNAAAFQTCRDVVDASRVLDVSDDLYWRAWAGMLEILEDQNEGGARSESITRQIARLRAEDNTLGGDLIKRRIEAVERKAKLERPAP